MKVFIQDWNKNQLSDYAGYLFTVNANRYKIVKHSKPAVFLSHAELMGLCLSGRLYIGKKSEVPHFYQKFLK